MLWIDGAGGFHVYFTEEVVIGGPGEGPGPRLVLAADLPLQAARIVRQGPWYLLEAKVPARLSGRELDGWTVLPSEAELQLADLLKIRFSRPNRLSDTATLVVAKPFRTLPRANAVVLMGQSCVLGPDFSCHVQLPHWSERVVLLKEKSQLVLRASSEFQVDGTVFRNRAVIPVPCRIVGASFSFALEPFSE